MKEIIASCGAIIVVDDDLYAELVKFNWHVKKNRVYRFKRQRRITLGKTVLKLNPITHKLYMINYLDGDILNNQRSNLEVVTRSAKVQLGKKRAGTSSKYKGVIYVGNDGVNRKKKWKAITFINGVSTHIGHFMTEDFAAVAYNLFVLKHIGKNAVLNNVVGMERYYEQASR